MGELIAVLRRHRIIGFDTSVFIYQIEEVPRFVGPASIALSELEQGAFGGVTSLLTLMELAVKPLQYGRPEVADEYQILIENFPNLVLADLDRETMRRAAELRATYRLRPADALHQGACLRHGATAFVTNDRRLRHVTEFDVLILEDYLDG